MDGADTSPTNIPGPVGGTVYGFMLLMTVLWKSWRTSGRGT